MQQRKKVPGAEGHRDEATLLKQREDAYRRHIIEGESLRSIAASFGVAVSTVVNDVAAFQNMLRAELPQTFEAWQMRLYSEYNALKEQAEGLYEEAAPGSLVRVQALKLRLELTSKLEGLFGVNKAIKQPNYAEKPEPDTITWG